MVKLKELQGFKESFQYKKYPCFLGKDSDNIHARDVQGFNQAIDQAADVTVEIDFRRLARNIRVYSYWDIGEADCTRISQAVRDNLINLINLKK